jgi:hypothetical protein
MDPVAADMAVKISQSLAIIVCVIVAGGIVIFGRR